MKAGSRWLLSVLLMILGLNLLYASAAVAGPLNIPPDLLIWQPWVMYNQEERLCPSLYNDGQVVKCAWPSRLELVVDKKGGRFKQEWLIQAKTWVPLPGSKGSWPGQVKVNGQAVPVMSRDGVPTVRLDPAEGSMLALKREPIRRQIEGTFTWADLPETIQIPAASGLVSLTINDRVVDFPVLDAGGRLWIQKRAEVLAQEDRFEVRVHRLLTDSIPMKVLTHLKLNVSGRSREMSLKGLLLSGTIPMNLTSPLPARLSQQGDLKLQARPGRWEINILARFEGPITTVGPVTSEFGREIWAFEPQNHLRQVKIEGVPAIDPGQTDLPAKWRNFSTYLMEPGAKIQLKEIRRGDPDPAPDRLSLHRTYWLDFDGRGLTIKDSMNGTMSRQWFLAMNPPGVLGRVAVDGQDQLITKQSREEKPGIELRLGRLNLEADSRLDTRPDLLPAVGWDHDFQSVSAVLNLPPGWRLFTASGVDVLPNTWFQKWSLLDLFIVLIVALAVFKLSSWRMGLLALVTLGLTYHEPAAPRLIWLQLLAAMALLRVLPEGWFKKLIGLWRLGVIVALIVIAIPFMIGQARQGIYPQLEAREWFADRLMSGDVSDAIAPKAKKDVSIGRYRAKAEPSAQPPSPAPREQQVTKQEYYQRNLSNLQQDPKALIQTGPGLPTWSWRAIEMKWNGPVDRGHKIKLWLLSPGANLFLSFLRVILLAGLIVTLINLNQWWRKITQAAPAAALAMLVFFSIGSAAWAQSPSPLSKPIERAAWPFPPNDLLEELKNRLLEKPDCLPFCAHFARMDFTASPDSLRILLEVHAAVDTVVPLPGSRENWRPAQVLLDNLPAGGLLRDQDGLLWLLTPAGVHNITLLGRPVSGAAFQIPIPLRPSRTTITSEGWEVVGLGEDGQVEASLQLTRLKSDRTEESLEGVSVLPPFLHVERTFILGLTWEVQTKVTRLTPPGTPIVIQVPILEGEAVTTAGIKVENHQTIVNMDAKTKEVGWISTLDLKDTIKLTSPIGVPWTETWTLEAGPVWHVELSGIPVIHHQESEGRWRPQWRPWPGESVTMNISRPRAIPGRTVTIDQASLEWTPGERSSQGGLTLKIRASQGGQHRLLFPAGTALEQVKINDRAQPIGQLQDGALVLPLNPGRQTIYVEWRSPTKSSVVIAPPKIGIGGQAVNGEVTLKLPRNLWVLWASGPRMGPAVLFWSYILIVIVAAWALGRAGWTPLKARHWFLLGLGLTQVHPFSAIAIIGWLLALEYRQRHQPAKGWFYFDLGQLVLTVWTVIALIGLYQAVEKGLLGLPQMQITGNFSYDALLKWTQDRLDGIMPQTWVLAVPLWIFRLLMLLWALWLALSLIRWLRWAWQAFTTSGAWRKPRFHHHEDKTSPEEVKSDVKTETNEFQLE